MAETCDMRSDPTTDEQSFTSRPLNNDGSGDASVQKKGKNSACDGMEWVTKLRDHLQTKCIDVAAAMSRLATIIFAIIFLIGGSQGFLQRALIANAFTSGLRLYQRMGGFPGGFPGGLTREFFAHVLIEDSCHYLLYSMIFLMFGAISFALLPPVMFAALHLSSFCLQIIEVAKSPNADMSQSRTGRLLQRVVFHTGKVLKFAASAEIILMPLIILNVFRGTVSLVAPLAYYRFIYFRYVSKRNHYTRIAFYEMRMSAEAIIARGCPLLLARLLNCMIMVLCRLAPRPIHN